MKISSPTLYTVNEARIAGLKPDRLSLVENVIDYIVLVI